MYDNLVYPPGWLVIGLPWPQTETTMAESACAIAPSILRQDMFSPDARTVFNFSSSIIRTSPDNTVFFSDLTRWLYQHDQDWTHIGVRDWQKTVDEIAGHAPGLFLTLSQVAHSVVCDATTDGMMAYLPGSSTPQNLQEIRQDVRSALSERIEADWPTYAQQALVPRN